MFFKPQDETILVDGKTQKYVLGSEKEEHARHANALLKQFTTESGKYLRFKNHEVNVIEEAMSRAPMFCNALTSQGYKNILFVGHFNDGQTHWMLNQESGRMIDLIPSERHMMEFFPDMNIVAQFIPLVMDTFGYECSFTVAHPPEMKHRGAMHRLYDLMGMGPHMQRCSNQYKHGHSSWTIEGEHEKFDAVVFLGVPMQDQEVGFEEDQVREIFAPMCTPEFDMVDIYYGAPSPVKWVNGEEKDSTTMVDTSFALRSSWDEEMSSGRQEECDIMHSMVKVF